jgi:CheY-like chemotaxis protein
MQFTKHVLKARGYRHPFGKCRPVRAEYAFLSEDQSKSREMAQNILLIQANGTDAAAVVNVLSKSHNGHIEWVDTCALGLRRLAILGRQDQPQASGISAILVDLQLPDAAGIEAFDRLHAANPQIPILILSSTEDEEMAKLAIQRGRPGLSVERAPGRSPAPQSHRRHDRSRSHHRGLVR